MKIVKFSSAFLILFFFTTIANSQELTALIRHVDCNALLSGEHKVEKITDFIKVDNKDLKLVEYSGVLRRSDMDNNINAILILKNDLANNYPKGLSKTYDAIFLKNFKDFANYSNHLFIVSEKVGKDEIITFFHVDNNRILGYPHKVGGKFCHTVESILKNELEAAKKDKQVVIWFGDDLTKIDIDKYLNDKDINYYIRNKDIIKSFPIAIKEFSKRFNAGKSAVCNAVPSTHDELSTSYISSNPKSLEAWQKYSEEVNNIINNKFKNNIVSKLDLKDYFMHGDDDIMFIVAHSDGVYLYINGQKISIKEIKTWGKRIKSTNGERTAVLVVCNAGNFTNKVGIVFKKEIESFSKILIEYNYFDRVIAPNHEIYKEEAIDVLKLFMNNGDINKIRKQYNGWIDQVSNFDGKNDIYNV